MPVSPDAPMVNVLIGARDLPGRVLPVLQNQEPTLLEVAQPVAASDPHLAQHLADLAATLDDFRTRYGFGRAIAAPQVGIAKRVILLNLGAGPVPIINPQIHWRSDAMQTVWDDCLSVPDCIVRVLRHASISLHFRDLHFNACRWDRLPPDLSELLQHEIDHLDGVLMTQRAGGPQDLAPIAERAARIGAQRPARRITLEGIARARETIDPVFLNSPQYECEPLSVLLGCRVTLKVETLNPIRSFKGRGASSFVRAFAARNPGTPLVAASAGNWGQALAYCCRQLDLPIVVFASTRANPFKLERMRALGADVRLHGGDFDAAKLEAKRFAAHPHASASSAPFFVEDGLEVAVTEGHGSIAVELINAMTRRADHLDAVLVPLGNGSMLNGMARWIKAASPATRVIGVCAEGAPAMRDAWLRVGAVDASSHDGVDTIADGIAVRVPVPEAVDDMHGLVDEVLLVSDAQILIAMRLAYEHAGVVLEPSGAVALAAIQAHPEQFRGQHVACVLCGGNLTAADARRWLGQGAPEFN